MSENWMVQADISYMEPLIVEYCRDINVKLEEGIGLTVEKAVGFHVDRDRLLQALTDARKFYEEGWRAAVTKCGLAKVVRCKDCKHCSTNTPDGLHWCAEHERGSLMDEDFCSYGERRVEDG